jgi:hypothetical protein
MLGVLTMANATQSQHGFHDIRHVMNSWALFTLLITTAYSSGLVSHLTVPTYSKKLDSIQALVEAEIYWSAKYYPAVDKLFDTEVDIFFHICYNNIQIKPVLLAARSITWLIKMWAILSNS